MWKLVKEFGLYFIKYYKELIHYFIEIIEFFIMLIGVIIFFGIFFTPAIIVWGFNDNFTILELIGILSTYFVLFPLYSFIMKKIGIKLQVKNNDANCE